MFYRLSNATNARFVTLATALNLKKSHLYQNKGGLNNVGIAVILLYARQRQDHLATLGDH